MLNSFDGTPIAYEVRGTGSPAVVFVHGWSCDRTYWEPQLTYFSKKYTVVAIDLGGHGASGIGREGWTIESFGKDVAAVVRKIGLKDVILVGHSMGGDVIPDAALELGARVRGMIWIDTYKKLGTGRKSEDVKAFIDSFRPNFEERTKEIVRSLFIPSSDPKLVGRIVEDMASAPSAVAIPALESSFHNSRLITLKLERLKLPVVAINPDDSPTDIESMKRYGVEVMIMSKVGHFLHLEDPARFNVFLGNAIAKLDKK
jgi:pimeloyl-ACP methyl ester carboxylesterase